MLITSEILSAIADGSVDRVYRRWRRPTVRAGSTLRTPVGVLTIDAVDPVDPSALGDDAAAAAGHPSVDDLLASLRPPGPDLVLYRIDLRWTGEDPRIALRQEGDLDDGDRAEVNRAIERTHDPDGHRRILSMIAARPEVAARDLATDLGLEAPRLKRMVRRLKELGLTESRPVGYRLSPRGRAWLDGERATEDG